MSSTNFLPVCIVEDLIKFIAAAPDPDEVTTAAETLILTAGYDQKWLTRQIQKSYDEMNRG